VSDRHDDDLDHAHHGRVPEHGHGPLPGEAPRIWDNPQNVRRLLWVVYGISAVLVLLDFVVDREIHHPWESFPAFYAIYGWAACVSLVIVAKQLRKVLIRSEDYYDAL
jgi:hypothetical protein